MKSLSIIIPIYNEEDTIPQLWNRLHATLNTLKEYTFTVIFVDDGSSDKSMQLLEKLHEKEKRISIIQFSRNFGHHIAVTAGLDHAHGDIVILMDGDLQNRPEDIPRLLQKMHEGYDIVYTIRKSRQDPFLKKVMSRFFIWFMGKVVQDPMTVGTSIFRALRQEVVVEIKKLHERNRYVIGLIDWTGFKQTSIEVKHDERFAGKTKYSFGKQLRLAFDAMFSFSTFPLQLATMFGFLITVFAFSYGTYAIIRRLIWGFTTEGFAAITVSIFFLGGVQLIILGIIGSYIGRIYTEVKQRPLYIIKRKLGN